MRSRLLNPWKLVILLVLLGGLIWLATWDSTKRRPKEKEQESESKQVFALKKDEVVDHITVSRRNEKETQALQFKCKDRDAGGKALCRIGGSNQWSLETAGGAVLADKTQVGDFVQDLQKLTWMEKLEYDPKQDGEWEKFILQFKLDEKSQQIAGARKLEITSAEGSTQTLLIGDEHPFGGKNYALNPAHAKEVVLIPKNLITQIDRDKDQWLDKSIFEFPAHEITRLDLQSSKLKLKATKEGANWWIDSNGKKILGSDNVLDKVILTLSQLKATKIVAGNKNSSAGKKLFSSAAAYLRGTLKLKNSEIYFEAKKLKEKTSEKVLLVHGAKDPVYEVNTYNLDSLNKELKDFRVKRLLAPAERFEAQKIEFSGTPVDPAPLVVQRNGEAGWTLAGGAALDSKKVDQALDELMTENLIRNYFPPSQTPGAPEGEKLGMKIRFLDAQGKAFREILLWKYKERLYARDLTHPKEDVYEINNVINAFLPWTSDAYSKK